MIALSSCLVNGICDNIFTQENWITVAYHGNGVYRPGESGGDSESFPTRNLRSGQPQDAGAAPVSSPKASIKNKRGQTAAERVSIAYYRISIYQSISHELKWKEPITCKQPQLQRSNRKTVNRPYSRSVSALPTTVCPFISAKQAVKQWTIKYCGL